MMKLKKTLQLFITSLLLLFLVKNDAFAFTMGSTNFSVDGTNFDTGGGVSSSPNFLVSSFAGEDYLANAASNNLSNSPGLAFLPSPTPTPTPTSASSSSSSTSTTTTTVVVTATPIPTPIPAQVALGPAEAGLSPTSNTPSQLFDIALIIDKPLIDNSRNLAARVTFTSFGTKDTPVDMDFVILDAAGKQRYKTTGKTVIQTEGVYNQAFKDLSIPNGKYTLLLSTLYNVNVKDEFRQQFEVRSQKSVLNFLWPWGLFIIPPLLLPLVIILWKRRHKT